MSRGYGWDGLHNSSNCDLTPGHVLLSEHKLSGLMTLRDSQLNSSGADCRTVQVGDL